MLKKIKDFVVEHRVKITIGAIAAVALLIVLQI